MKIITINHDNIFSYFVLITFQYQDISKRAILKLIFLVDHTKEFNAHQLVARSTTKLVTKQYN